MPGTQCALRPVTIVATPRTATDKTAIVPGLGGRSFMGVTMIELTLKLKLSYRQFQYMLALLMLFFS